MRGLGHLSLVLACISLLSLLWTRPLIGHDCNLPVFDNHSHPIDVLCLLNVSDFFLSFTSVCYRLHVGDIHCFFINRVFMVGPDN